MPRNSLPGFPSQYSYRRIERCIGTATRCFFLHCHDYVKADHEDRCTPGHYSVPSLCNQEKGPWQMGHRLHHDKPRYQNGHLGRYPERLLYEVPAHTKKTKGENRKKKNENKEKTRTVRFVLRVKKKQTVFGVTVLALRRNKLQIPMLHD